MKTHDKNIYVLGDVHADFKRLNRFIDMWNPDIILQCGDFGYWPALETIYQVNTINNNDTKIYFCDGNHEDHYSLKDAIKKNKTEVARNVFYMPRGSVLALPDGRKVLFVGGAFSIDWQHRIDGRDWFSEDELLKEKDIQWIYDMREGDIDIVISHTAPQEFKINLGWGPDENIDPSRKVLSYILEKLKPPKWYFGHWHMKKSGEHIFRNNKSCKWNCVGANYHECFWLKL